MKYVVLSVNDNYDYLYFTPLTCWAWSQFGWNPIIFFHGQESDLTRLALLHPKNQCRILPLDQNGYRSDTITQVSRLYAACIQDGYLLTGDIDMIPLSDHWKENNEITIYGNDLTGGRYYPMCYIGMPSYCWKDIMGLYFENYNALIKRDLDAIPSAKGTKFDDYWYIDQNLITERINNSKNQLH